MTFLAEMLTNAADVSANLKNRVTKPEAQKALTSLAGKWLQGVES